MVKMILVRLVTWIESIDESLTYHPFVIRQAEAVLSNGIRNIHALACATEHTVRLYSLEGIHLSHKNGERTRMTWYTSPITAKEIGEYMGGLTGRLVYVDLDINILSPYSQRYYKRGDEAYTLKGELITKAKNSWKYVRLSAEVAVGRE